MAPVVPVAPVAPTGAAAYSKWWMREARRDRIIRVIPFPFSSCRNLADFFVPGRAFYTRRSAATPRFGGFAGNENLSQSFWQSEKKIGITIFPACPPSLLFLIASQYPFATLPSPLQWSALFLLPSSENLGRSAPFLEGMCAAFDGLRGRNGDHSG